MSGSERLVDLVTQLKAAAEPTRLRLLAMLQHGELTVGEICKVLGQSQPRVSRHLRLMAEAGFLDRIREQQCVYYRVPVQATALLWARQLLQPAAQKEPLLRRDRERMNQVISLRGRAAERAWPEARTAAAAPDELVAMLAEEIGPVGLGVMLDIGTGSGRMLEIVARRASRAVGVDISALALRLARARVHGCGLHHCEFQRGDMYALPCEDASFDTVTIDRVLSTAERPVDVLSEAARALRPNGRLILVEDFEQFDTDQHEDALHRLRHWFAQSGFKADRLRPCDLGAGQYLIATARRISAGPNRKPSL